MTLQHQAQRWTVGKVPHARLLQYGSAFVLACCGTAFAAALSSRLGGGELLAGAGSVAIAAAFAGRGPALVTAALVAGAYAMFRSAAGSGASHAQVIVFLAMSAAVAHVIGWSRGAFFEVLARRHHGSARIRGRLAFLRAVTRAMDEGVYTIDPAGRITYVNAAAERMLGYRARDLIGRPFKEALRCRRSDAVCSGSRCRLRNVMSSGEPYRAANDMLTRSDGTRFPVRYSSAPIRRGGAVVGAVVAFQDTTSERRAASNERFLAQATEQLASSIDYDETLARVARLALPHLGDWCMAVVLEEDGEPRRVAVEALDPERAESAREMLKRYPIDLEADHGAGRVLRTGEPELIPVVTDFVGRKGSTVGTRAALLDALGLRSFMAVPMSARGRLVGVLDFGFARGERRFGAEDLALATELARRCALAIDNARLHRAAREAVRAREHMLAIVSHDLRNPLGAIQMAAGIVAKVGTEAPLAVRVRNAAVTIGRSCDRMNRLIGDLVDTARLDAGHLSIAPGECSASVLAAEAVECVATVAAEAGVRVDCEDDGMQLRVAADRDRVQQVLVNLISNAVKVTRRGGRVWVRCRARRGAAIFSVSDRGPGISREQQASIFEPYVRGPAARYQGTGLGLSIARGIVEAHRGRLWVVSREGRGATFRFTLPLVQLGAT